MTDNSSGLSSSQKPIEQGTTTPAFTTNPSDSNASLHKMQLNSQISPDKLKSQNPSDEEKPHPLYEKYRPRAENTKIIAQMLIGTTIGIFLLIQICAYIIEPTGHSPLHLLATLNPLDIVAYGLYFSTGIDLAYMLFTPGPDEAIDPLMTGLAATILLGIAKIDFGVIQSLIQQGITLFLAIAALAGLFATKKYLFYPKERGDDQTSTEKRTQ